MPAYKDGDTWFVKFYYQDWTGERKVKKKRGFKTKKEALQFERSFIDKASGENNSITVSDLCDQFLEFKRNRVKPTTLRGYQQAIDNHIKPYFGSRPAASVTPLDVIKWQNSQYDTASGNTLHGRHVVLSSIYNFGRKYYKLTNNPASEAGFQVKEDPPKLKFWTKDQYDSFMETITDPKAYILYETLYWSGMRIGELLALTFSDIDWENNIIRIRRNMVRVDGQNIVYSPKTKSSVRDVLMPGFYMDELREYSDKIYDKSGRLFEFVSNANAVQKVFRDRIRKTDLPEITIHDLRHSHASLLINMGAPVVLVSDRLGHGDSSVTLRVYSHLFPSKQKEIVDRLNQLR